MIRIKLTVRSSNGKALESVSVNSRESRIEIKFLPELVSTKELDFDFTVTLSVDGRRQSDYDMSFTGTLANPVTEVYADSGPVDISNGTIAEAKEYISNIELMLQKDVSVTARMLKGKRCYGIITHTPEADDEAVKAEYPAIDDVVTLKAVGLDSTGNAVRFGDGYGGYHVYDKNLNYLGTTRDAVPFSDKYYLAAEKLDIAASAPSAKNDDLMASADFDALSDTEDSSTANINDNPNTGR